MAEAILDLDVEAGRTEDPMDQVLKPGAVDVEQLVGGDDFDIGHEEGRVELRIGEAARNVTAGHADFVQHVAVGRDGWMFGLAAQHIDNAAGLVPFLIVIGEQRAGRRLDNPPSGGVLLQRLLKRPHEKIALGAVVEDHTKAGVDIAMFIDRGLFHSCDIGFRRCRFAESR